LIGGALRGVERFVSPGEHERRDTDKNGWNGQKLKLQKLFFGTTHRSGSERIGET
jgi:hypothetical protein